MPFSDVYNVSKKASEKSMYFEQQSILKMVLLLLKLYYFVQAAPKGLKYQYQCWKFFEPVKIELLHTLSFRFVTYVLKPELTLNLGKQFRPFPIRIMPIYRERWASIPFYKKYRSFKKSSSLKWHIFLQKN